MRRPPTKIIKRVFDWLAENDMYVYGPHMDVDTGQEYPSNRDYDADEAIKRYNHIKNDTLWRDHS